MSRGGPTRTWKDNAIINLGGTEYENGECVDMAQIRINWRAFVKT
jgi:hypothetical protein